jgi:parallel beta-helix repeat protein
MKPIKIFFVLVAAIGSVAYAQQSSPEWMWSPGLGLYLSTVTPELAKDAGLSQEKGFLVVATERGGPADKAGVKPGDIITSLSAREAWSEEGKQARIELSRDGKTQSIDLVSHKAAADATPELVLPEVTPGPPTTYFVDPAGSEKFRTITGALYRAKAGDTITLKPGRYTESVLVRPGVIIRASEPGSVRIEPARPWILQRADSSEISNLIFVGSGLWIENTQKASLTGNTVVVPQKKTGLTLLNSHDVTVTRCNFQGAAETFGIDADRSALVVSDSVFTENGYWAISLRNNSQADIHKNLMEGNQNGINASDSSVVAERNIITGVWDPDKKDSGGIGFRAEKSAATWNKNSIRRYSRGFVSVNSSSPAKVSDNTISQNLHAIVLLASDANLSKNLIIQNRGSGVYVGVPEKEEQSKPQEVTISQNTIAQSEGTAINAESFNHLTITQNLIEANHWGIRVDSASATLENNTIVLQSSTGINVQGKSEARIYNNIVAFNGFGIFADVASHREAGYNDVYGNLISTDFPLRDGNYGRSDRFTTHGNQKVPIEVYPAYDLKGSTDLSVDPGFVKIGSDYTLKATSSLARIRGEKGRYLGAYAPVVTPLRTVQAQGRKK